MYFVFLVFCRCYYVKTDGDLVAFDDREMDLGRKKNKRAEKG